MMMFIAIIIGCAIGTILGLRTYKQNTNLKYLGLAISIGSVFIGIIGLFYFIWNGMI